jgi:hypothetical protein
VATPKAGRQTALRLSKEGDVDKQHKSRSWADLRLCAAMIAGSVVLAMAAVGLMLVHEHDGYAVAKSGSMTAGATSTQTTPSNVPAVGVVQPSMKGPAPLQSQREAAR